MDRIVRGVVFVVLLSGALALVGAADAGTLVRDSAVQFRFTAATTETNQIEISLGTVPGRFNLSDSAHAITLGQAAGDCTGGGTTTVSCPLGSSVFVFLSDGNDRSVIHDDVPMTFLVDGAEGDDDVEGGGLADLLLGGDGNDVLRGDGGDDRIVPGIWTDNADGGAGTDTIDYYDGRNTGVTVSLLTGAGPEGDQLAGFEAIRGTASSDDLTGDGSNNVIRGFHGADTLDDGGGGFDVLSYEGQGSAVVVNVVTGANSAGDTLRGQWEGVMGTPGDDVLSAAGGAFPVVLDGGPGGNDILTGGALGDTLVGGSGADVLIGGGAADLLYGNTTSGTPDGVGDTVSYDDGRTTPVVTELAGGHQDGDYYSDIEHLTGGNGDDLLIGDVGPNVLIGLNGADVLVGADGADDLRGGFPDGTRDVSLDVASYRDRGVPVLATLGGITPDGDRFSDIGGLEGGGAGDILTGDAGPNLLLGGAGNDSLHGGRGSDDLLAGEGEDSIEAEDGERDTVNCGPGVDIHVEDAIDTLVECEAEAPPRRPAAVRCVVPNVKKMSVAGARRLLRARHCTLGQVRRVYSEVRKGWIVSQSRRPGARLPRNAKVNVVVSRGRRR